MTGRKHSEPMIKLRLSWVVTLLLPLLVLQRMVYANPQFLTKAQKEFADGRYDRARDAYRRYIKTQPNDGDAWSQLAVSIYFCGQPENALYYLQKWESKARNPTYNFFYQGLVLQDLNDLFRAKAALAKAARYADEYAARATYELAVLEYREANLEKFTYWASLYRSRYGQGGYITALQRMEMGIRSGTIAAIEGNRRPDLDQSIFKFHPWSIYPTPHFWYFQAGYLFGMGDEVNPDRKSVTGTKPESFSSHDLRLRAILGVGPLRRNDFESVFGYSYQQDWYTTDDRLQEFIDFEEAMDVITYFPFRPDLMERTHRVFADVAYTFPKYAKLGMMVFQEFSFVGSNVIPSGNNGETEQFSAKTRDAHLLKPYARFNFVENWDILLYLYMYKEIVPLFPEISKKTYGFEEPTISFGLNQNYYIPKYQIDFKLDFFMFDYIYNDYWSDFSRMGAIGGASMQVEPQLRTGLAVGYYEDDYKLSMIRSGQCVYRKRDTTQTEPVVYCPRKDSGMIYQAELSYDFSQMSQVLLRYTMVENRNSSLAIFEKTEHSIEARFSMAFPQLRRVSPYVESFGDVAREKKNE